MRVLLLEVASTDPCRMKQLGAGETVTKQSGIRCNVRCVVESVVVAPYLPTLHGEQREPEAYWRLAHINSFNTTSCKQQQYTKDNRIQHSTVRYPRQLPHTLTCHPLYPLQLHSALESLKMAT